MPERKLWTSEQDKALRWLREEEQCKKWAVIARRMHQDFGIQGRSGKQCRERYHNHLDGLIVASQWTVEEEEQLFGLHSEMGNKWALIAQRLPGRTDNSIKNHFYSKLRKSLRRLNKFIHDHHRKTYQQLKVSTLYKILQISESKFKTNSRHDEHLVEHCLSIKNKLYQLPHQLQPTSNHLEKNENQFESSQTHLSPHQLESLILDLTRLENRICRVAKNSTRRESESSTCSKFEGESISRRPETPKPFYLLFKKVCEQLLEADPC